MSNGTVTVSAIEKQRLRRELRDRRARFVGALPPSVRAMAFRVLPRPVMARLPDCATVALYHAVGYEAPTERLAHQLSDLGFMLAMPRIGSSPGQMDFAFWSPDTILQPGPFRTLQPGPGAPALVPDVIVTPMVGFDPLLSRLGQGGGYYDRAFAAYPDALRIGLAWSVQQVDALPVESFDRPLDLVVTEGAIHERP